MKIHIANDSITVTRPQLREVSAGLCSETQLAAGPSGKTKEHGPN